MIKAGANRLEQSKIRQMMADHSVEEIADALKIEKSVVKGFVEEFSKKNTKK